jgi:hypothetical protein
MVFPFGVDLLQQQKKLAWLDNPLANRVVLAGTLILSVIYTPDKRIYFLASLWGLIVLILLTLRSTWVSGILTTPMIYAFLIPWI